MALFISACGGNEAESSDNNQVTTSPAGLTAFQTENGIGPITTKMTLADIDAVLAAEGEAMFKIKCAACHKVDKRYVGPALAGVTERRTPEYLMNMMLNPAEMVEKHPEAKAMLAEFMSVMPNQNLNEEDARVLLEYLRTI